MIEVEVMQDNDGHWYVIPSSKQILFLSLLKNNMIDSFEENFSHYATGGDVNQIQLYADIQE